MLVSAGHWACEVQSFRYLRNSKVVSARLLLAGGLKLITRQRKNMKPIKKLAIEKQLLSQRGIIETVIRHLKHHSLSSLLRATKGGAAIYFFECLHHGCHLLCIEPKS